MTRVFVGVEDVVVGTVLIADDYFDCILGDSEVVVHADAEGQLYVPCSEGCHYLDGQLSNDGETYVGFSLSADTVLQPDDVIID